MYKIIFVVICAVLVLQFTTSLKNVKGAPLKVDGQQVEFQFTNDYRMVAGMGEDISGKYLVIGAAPVNGAQMGHLGVLPMAVADQFKAKYGDYRKCSSEGADEAKASVIDMSVLIEDRQVQDALKEVAARVKDGTDPIITLEGVQLDLIKYYYRDEKGSQGPENFITNHRFYFIKSLEL